ncbi:hypothetical protein B0H17DRAFT_1201484 [Mycena rosella]|uniref:Uncharacterized protein n=1 Tax=Mycena rosella TaxID=1033263 RepID=A0AAD7GE51_MYCRO|nr:hypothetical protein B0H17DRAFT_1201484 [Mycena rosella]
MQCWQLEWYLFASMFLALHSRAPAPPAASYPTLNASIPHAVNLRLRSIRYSGTRCYNERNQPISCPMSRTNLIIIAVIVGFFVLGSLALYCLTRCTCRCRRRKSISTLDLYRADPEFQFQPGSQYLKLAPSSMETLVEPEKIHPATHPYPRY